MNKKCRICGGPFHPNRSWQKYCSPKCRKKGKVLNAINWRNRQPPYLEDLTIEKIKSRDLHKFVYKNVLRAFSNDGKGGMSWSQLYRKSGVSDRTLFKRYLNTFCKLGILKEEKEGYSLSKRFQFEPLKLKGIDTIMKTDMECAVFRYSPELCWTYYNPWIEKDYIYYKVKNLNERVRKIEDHLKTADRMWVIILAEARDNYLRELWDKKILRNRKIYVLTKFKFCLDIIFQLRHVVLWLVSPAERSFDKQLSLLAELKRKAFERYIQERYSMLTPSQIEKVRTHIKSSYESNRDFLVELWQRIILLYGPNPLEHVIVIDWSGISADRQEELRKMGIDTSVSIERDKPIGEHRRKLEDLSHKRPMQDELANKKLPVDKRFAGEELYVKPPFFKDFFQGFEEDLMNVGFKQGRGSDGLENFYEYLDRTATIIRIPSLPDDPDVLLL